MSKNRRIARSSALRFPTDGLVRQAVMAAAVACLAAGPAAAQDIAAVRAASCNACHGPAGRSIAGIPPLAGRPAQQLLDALLAFKNDRRTGYVMNQHAKGYTDEQLREIAEAFAREKPGEEAPR